MNLKLKNDMEPLLFVKKVYCFCTEIHKSYSFKSALNAFNIFISYLGIETIFLKIICKQTGLKKIIVKRLIFKLTLYHLITGHFTRFKAELKELLGFKIEIT